MIDTAGIYDLRGTFGAIPGATRPDAVDRLASADVRTPSSQNRSVPPRSDAVYATGQAQLLAAMFQRMGGANTSTAKGAYVDLTA